MLHVLWRESSGFFVSQDDEPLTILVATSGDTGGAVADAFSEIEGIDVVILYPLDRVSRLQELQLTSYGSRVRAFAVHGTFDDCQALVKRAFHDQSLQSQIRLSSANSINIVRLIPQMFYYAYACMHIDIKEPLTISVPSGNFGNLAAAVMAQKIGLPIKHFIAACNVNDTVPRFIESGDYAPNKAQATLSNAMDVSDPSNFQRLFALYDNDIDTLRKHVSAYSFDDAEVKKAIISCLKKFDYLIDPHTAVSYLGLKKYGVSKKTGGFCRYCTPRQVRG